MNSRWRLLRTLPLAVFLLTVVGCAAEEATQRTEQPAFDAARLGTDLETVRTVLGTDVWQSFEALGPRFGTGPGPGLAVPGPGDALRTGGDPQAIRELAFALLRDALARPPAVAAVPRIPFDLRGTTFVLDPVSLEYVPDPDRFGAPDNGIRFILYAVNPVTREPIVETEIGFADFTDEGDALEQGISLRFEVVSGGATFVDYLVTAEGTETSGALDITGFISDGMTRVEFTMTASGMQVEDVETGELSFEIRIAQREFWAAATLRSTDGPDGQIGTLDLTVEVGDARIEFSAEAADAFIDATFTVNGQLFATVRGNPASPEIAGAEGRPLSAQERHVLHELTQLSGRVFEMFGHLMQPAGAILGVGGEV